MDLNTIKQYNHRIDKIIITNNNTYSLYSEVMFKVSFDNKYEQKIILELTLIDNTYWH